MGNCAVTNTKGFTPVEGEEGPCSPVWERLQVELEEGWCLLRAGKASVPHGTQRHSEPENAEATLCFSFPPNNSGNYVNQK